MVARKIIGSLWAGYTFITGRVKMSIRRAAYTRMGGFIVMMSLWTRNTRPSQRVKICSSGAMSKGSC